MIVEVENDKRVCLGYALCSQGFPFQNYHDLDPIFEKKKSIGEFNIFPLETNVYPLKLRLHKLINGNMKKKISYRNLIKKISKLDNS